MSYSTILALIKTQLEAVTGIGKVHDYLRLSDNLEKSGIELFTSNQILHTWMITRVSMPAVANTSFQVERRHEWDLIGFYQINDSEATEKTFQALCDTIMDKFDSGDNVVLDGNTDQEEPAQLVSFEAVDYMGVTCHRAIIRIMTFEEFDGG